MLKPQHPLENRGLIGCSVKIHIILSYLRSNFNSLKYPVWP